MNSINQMSQLDINSITLEWLQILVIIISLKQFNYLQKLDEIKLHCISI